jgi:mannitol-1-phosphate 5-dehydrogenase
MVTFLDVAEALVSRIACDGCYTRVIVDDTGQVEETIAPVTAVDSRDLQAAGAALDQADLVATSVGARFLPAVADVLAPAIGRRIKAGAGPLDVLLAENLHDCAQVMRGLLAERLPEVPPEVLQSQVGLMETSIGRMIPVRDPEAQKAAPTTIFVEPYEFLPYDAAAGHGVLRGIPGFVADDSVPFAFYGDRKLYIHNMGHCLTAYAGELAGYHTITEAIADPGIRFLARAAMVESAVGLSSKYRVPMPGLLAHVDDLLVRFANRALGDTVERVGRDPERKMAAGDRMLGAWSVVAEAGLPGHYVSCAVALGALKLLQEPGWDEPRLWAHLEDALTPGVLAPRRDLLEAQIAALRKGFDFTAHIALIAATYRPPHVI